MPKTWVLASPVGRRFPKPHSKLQMCHIYRDVKKKSLRQSDVTGLKIHQEDFDDFPSYKAPFTWELPASHVQLSEGSVPTSSCWDYERVISSKRKSRWKSTQKWTCWVWTGHKSHPPNWGSFHPQFSSCVPVPFESFHILFYLSSPKFMGPSQLLLWQLWSWPPLGLAPAWIHTRDIK